MYNELPKKVYKTVDGLMDNEIFKKELELILVTREIQATYGGEYGQNECFARITILVKAEDGKYYKIQLQNDRSELDEDKNVKQYVIEEVDYLDIRLIGLWAGENHRGYLLTAQNDYYRPKGKGKHKVYIRKGEDDAVRIGDYGYAKLTDDYVWVFLHETMTTKIDGRQMNVYDLVKMANARGLRPNYLKVFCLLWGQ